MPPARCQPGISTPRGYYYYYYYYYYYIRCCCGDVSRSPSDGNFFWLLLALWGYTAPIIGAGCRGRWVWGMQGDSGIVIEDVCEDGMQNLGGRLVMMLMRAGILVAEVVVVAVGVMVVVAMGVISFF